MSLLIKCLPVNSDKFPHAWALNRYLGNEASKHLTTRKYRSLQGGDFGVDPKIAFTLRFSSSGMDKRLFLLLFYFILSSC